MRSDSRIIMILGIGGDLESDFIQAMTSEHDTLWLEAPFGASFHSVSGDGSGPSDPLEEARSYFAGAPAVQSLRIEDIGALQRAADAIATRHGHLDMLVIGSRDCFAGVGGDLPWQRHAEPYRFDELAPIVTLLPLLMRSPAARVVKLASQATTEADLRPLLDGTSVRVEHISLSLKSAADGEAALNQAAARDGFSLTTL